MPGRPSKRTSQPTPEDEDYQLLFVFVEGEFTVMQVDRQTGRRQRLYGGVAETYEEARESSERFIAARVLSGMLGREVSVDT